MYLDDDPLAELKKKYGVAGADATEDDPLAGLKAKYGVGGAKAETPDWYVRSSDLRKNNYQPQQPAPEGFIERRIAKEREKMRRLGDNPLGYIGSAIGDTAVGMANPGTIVRGAREMFSDEPLGIEEYLPDPTVGRVAKGLLVDTPLGMGQLAANIGGSDEAAMRMNQAATMSNEYFNERLRPSASGEIMGQMLPYLGTGGGPAMAGPAQQLTGGARLLNAAKVGAQRTGIGAGLSAPMVDPNADSRGEYLGNMAGRMAVGGTLSAGLPLLASGASWLGRTIRGKKVPRPDLAGGQKAMAEMEAEGVSPTVGQATGDPKILANEEEFLARSEKFQNWKLEQAQKAKAKAESSVDKIQRIARENKWDDMTEINKAAMNPKHPRHAKALEIKDEIASAGVDADSIIQASGKQRYFNKKIEADKLASEADAAARPYGNVDVSSAASDMSRLGEQVESNTAITDGTRSLIKRMAGGLTKASSSRPTRVPEVKDVYGTVTKEAQVIGDAIPEGPTQDTTFSGMRSMLSELNKQIAAESKTVSPSGVSIKHLQDAANIVKNAMKAHADKHPALADKYNKFLDFYKKDIVPYKDATFGKALAAEDATKAGKILMEGDLAQKKRYFELLGDKGKATARAKLVTEAVKSGYIPKQGTKGVELDPGKVSDQIRKWDSDGTLELMFQGDERKAVEGLENIMRTVRSAAKVESVPDTPLLKTLRINQSSGFHEAASRFYYKFSEDRLLRMYTDKNSKLFLVRASKLKPGDPEIVRWLSQFGKTQKDKLGGK
jgi:hypothetical protein